jgi:peptidoglycan hydrolase-like protein with peptidoglycan-binding domain
MGYGPLVVDGVIGPKTRAAVVAFQRARKLPMTGALDAATSKALGGHA